MTCVGFSHLRDYSRGAGRHPGVYVQGISPGLARLPILIAKSIFTSAQTLLLVLVLGTGQKNEEKNGFKSRFKQIKEKHKKRIFYIFLCVCGGTKQGKKTQQTNKKQSKKKCKMIKIMLFVNVKNYKNTTTKSHKLSMLKFQIYRFR